MSVAFEHFPQIDAVERLIVRPGRFAVSGRQPVYWQGLRQFGYQLFDVISERRVRRLVGFRDGRVSQQVVHNPHRQALRQDYFARTGSERRLDDIFQLTDVAGEGVATKYLERFIGEDRLSLAPV